MATTSPKRPRPARLDTVIDAAQDALSELRRRAGSPRRRLPGATGIAAPRRRAGGSAPPAG